MKLHHLTYWAAGTAMAMLTCSPGFSQPRLTVTIENKMDTPVYISEKSPFGSLKAENYKNFPAIIASHSEVTKEIDINKYYFTITYGDRKSSGLCNISIRMFNYFGNDKYDYIVVNTGTKFDCSISYNRNKNNNENNITRITFDPNKLS